MKLQLRSASDRPLSKSQGLSSEPQGNLTHSLKPRLRPTFRKLPPTATQAAVSPPVCWGEGGAGARPHSTEGVKKLAESQWGTEGLQLRNAPRKPGLATVLSPHLSRDFAAAGGEAKSFCCPFLALCGPPLSKASAARLKASQDGPYLGSDAARRGDVSTGRWGHNWGRGTKTKTWDSEVG